MTTIVAFMLGAVMSADLDPLTHLGSLTEELRTPARVVVTADDTVLVTDLFYDHLARFDAAGQLIGTWDVPEGPIGVAAHPDGRIFVSHRSGRKVAIYDAGFNFLEFLGEGIVTFAKPTDLDVDAATGRIYVVDSGADRVYGFESNGDLALMAGARGERSGEFMYPSAIRVDGARDRLIVADHDNFRVQVLTTDGLFMQRFGGRIKYVPGRGGIGWMPRTQGLVVDEDGYVFVADAMMSTVRIFTPGGSDLGKVIDYGRDAGDVRTPGGMALNANGTRLYVVSTNSASVEIYEAPDLGDGGGRRGGGGGSPGGDDVISGLDAAGQFTVSLAHALGRQPRRSARQVLVQLGMPDIVEPGRGTMTAGYEGPHMIDGSVICGRCHAIDGQPGGHPGLVEGQWVLCASCHSGGGQALRDPVHELDTADPYGTNPNAPDGKGLAHAWGVPAVNAQAASTGPLPGGQINRYLDDNGNIKCATCHNQHSSEEGEPYMRVQNDRDQMCRECHAPRDKGPYREDPINNRATHPVDMTYPVDADRYTPADDLEHVIVKAGRVECMSCHALHEADSGGANGGLGDGMLLRTVNDHALCMECHNGPLAPKTHGDLFPQGCMTCHDPHENDGNNLWLIRTTVEFEDDPVPVSFTDNSTGVGPGAYVDPDPNVKGICEACHAYPSDDPNLSPRHSLNWMPRCTECHRHHNAFEFEEGNLPPDTYVGADECARCHADMHEDWDETLHAEAWQTLNGIGQGRNQACLGCHTVGFGQNTGYVSPEATPHLANVQCENCHGAGSNHVNRAEASRIVVNYEAELCGACHIGSHHDTFPEWEASGHANTREDAHGTPSCNECHAPTTQPGELPARDVECVACHTPHARTGLAKEPVEGKDYQLKYQEVKYPTPSHLLADAINKTRFGICGQCHHSRSTVWTATTRGPHHSLQANVYLGEMPVPPPPNDQILVPHTASVHADAPIQCVTCHMYTKEYEGEQNPAITGHTWEMDFRGCVGCHPSVEEAREDLEELHAETNAALADITARLGVPSTWEYSAAGGPPEVCDPDPNLPCQARIPVEIKQVRFLKKYVENDMSGGAHNPDYVRAILDKADEILLSIGR